MSNEDKLPVEKVVVLADSKRRRVLKLLKEYKQCLNSLKELEQLIYDEGGLFVFRQMLNRDPVTRRPEKVNPLVSGSSSNIIFVDIYRSSSEEIGDEKNGTPNDKKEED